MAIALPLLVQLFDTIEGTVQWLSGGPSPGASSRQEDAPAPALPHREGATPIVMPQAAARPSGQLRKPQRHWSGPTRAAQSQRPVRVVREADARRGHAAGRMVISGRLADVCAELDRLAAQEAAR